jgi:hypothetical protein
MPVFTSAQKGLLTHHACGQNETREFMLRVAREHTAATELSCVTRYTSTAASGKSAPTADLPYQITLYSAIFLSSMFHHNTVTRFIRDNDMNNVHMEMALA